ncbi:MAG: cell wall hydrolase [Clostridia bacterium]
MKRIKKYISCVFSIFVLLILLYLSLNNSFNSIDGKIYASQITNNKESNKDDKKTDESSTKTDKPNAGNDMVELLARLINGEARGEPYLGQVAVGAVILNRVKSSEFPNTISAVIYQNNQFSCVKDGQFDQAMEQNTTVYKAAQEAMNGADPTNGALYFYNPAKTSNKYLYSLPTVATIGKHVFALGE